MSLQRLARDGWRVEPGERVKPPRTAPYYEVFDRPIVQSRALSNGRVLVVETHATHERNGRPYVETATVRGGDGATLVDFGRVDWADADHTGDVLLARNGRLCRLTVAALDRGGPSAEPTLVADLNDLAFEPVATPPHALRWP